MAVISVLICTFVFITDRVRAAPEDWVSSGSPFSPFASDDNRADTFTSANLNISVRTKAGHWHWEKSEVGRYGGGYVGPANGQVVHVASRLNSDDHTGCQLPFVASDENGQLPGPETQWIALIKRGRCNFEIKVENAFRSNASGVIVYNDRDSSTLDKMKLSSDSGRNISAVFIYKWKGEDLAHRLKDKDIDKMYVHITIAGHTSSRTANINRTSVLFVSVTFIILMIISLAWLVFYYVQRFRYIHAKDRLSRRLGNAAKKALSKIPTKNIKTEDKEIQGDSECCAVCIEPYKTSDVLRILPCGHEFHKSCIDPWLLEHRTCPMCKMDILKHYGFVFTGSQESILQVDVEEVAALEIGSTSGTRVNLRRQGGGGISPMPEIPNTDRQRLFENGPDDETTSSRSSTPDEMTPSLSGGGVRRQQLRTIPVPQDLCVSCIAAAKAAATTPNTKLQLENSTTTSSPNSSTDTTPSSTSTTHNNNNNSNCRQENHHLKN